MGSKLAVIINYDSEKRHLENVENSSLVLSSMGYEVVVVGSYQPKGVNQFFEDDESALEYLRATSSTTDEYVVYATGHGGLVDGRACIAQDGVECDADIYEALDAVTKGKRRIAVLDLCKSGSTLKIFSDDSKTLFISAGSDDEVTCCDDFAPYFWAGADQITDVNGDKKISWQDRYNYAVQNVVANGFRSMPQFVPTEDFVDEGKGSFEAKVIKVDDKEGLDRELAALSNGQYAFVLFSMPSGSCRGCNVYKPLFENMAAIGGGQHKFIFTENIDLADSFGVKEFPTVVAFKKMPDQSLYSGIVDRDDILAGLSGLELSFKERTEMKIAAALKKNTVEKARALTLIVRDLIKSDYSDADIANELIAKTIKIVEGIEYPGIRAISLAWIAQGFSLSNEPGRAMEIYRQSMAIITGYIQECAKINVSCERELAIILGTIIDADLGESAYILIDDFLAEVNNIEDPNIRGEILANISKCISWLKRGTNTVKSYDKLIDCYEKLLIDNNFRMTHNFDSVPADIASANLGDEEKRLLERLSSVANKIENEEDRALVLKAIDHVKSPAKQENFDNDLSADIGISALWRFTRDAQILNPIDLDLSMTYMLNPYIGIRGDGGFEILQEKDEENTYSGHAALFGVINADIDDTFFVRANLGIGWEMPADAHVLGYGFLRNGMGIGFKNDWASASINLVSGYSSKREIDIGLGTTLSMSF